MTTRGIRTVDARVLIPIVDTGLERLLRAELSLGEDVGDVSFDAPTGTWSAQLSRITVNVFLFGISRSSQPARPSVERTTPDGRRERRPPSPLVELDYVLSVYAGSPRDEHELLSDVLAVFVRCPVLPAEHLPQPLDSPVQLVLARSDIGRMKDVWGSVGGSLRPSIEVTVTAALDGLPWQVLPPLVERIEPAFVPLAERTDRTADRTPDRTPGRTAERSAQRGPDRSSTAIG